MDKKQTITTERKIGKITYLVQALPSEKATEFNPLKEFKN